MDLSTISSITRDLVPIGLIITLLLFMRLGIRAKSLRSVQTELSIFIVIWVIAELIRAMLLLGVMETNPTLEFLSMITHTIAMIAFGFFMMFRFYRHSAGR